MAGDRGGAGGHPTASDCSTAMPERWASIHPAAKASPAPVGSTSSTGSPSALTVSAPWSTWRGRPVLHHHRTHVVEHRTHAAEGLDLVVVGEQERRTADPAQEGLGADGTQRGGAGGVDRDGAAHTEGHARMALPAFRDPLAQQRVARQVEPPREQIEHVDHRPHRQPVVGAPRSGSMVRSPSGPTSTTHAPVAVCSRIGPAKPTPASARCSLARRPRSSSPTAARSRTGTPNEASQVAVLAAEPPPESRIRAAVSEPGAMGSGARPRCPPAGRPPRAHRCRARRRRAACARDCSPVRRSHGDPRRQGGVAQDDLHVGPEGLAPGGLVHVGQEERGDRIPVDAGGVGRRQPLEQRTIMQREVDLPIRTRGLAAGGRWRRCRAGGGPVP